MLLSPSLNVVGVFSLQSNAYDVCARPARKINFFDWSEKKLKVIKKKDCSKALQSDI